MHPSKRQMLSSRNTKLVAAICLALGVATLAYGSDGADTSAVRHIKDGTIFSDALPKVRLDIPRDVRFIGAQRVNLNGKAEAEQYVFARSGRNKIVDRFYLIQFEYFFQTNNLTYNYATMQTAQVGDFQFNHDVKSFSSLGDLLQKDQGSDGQAMERLLESKQLVLPRNAVLVRMFYLPSADHRTELMIVYGEALPQNTNVPLREGGVPLDTEAPSSAQKFLKHARQGLIVRAR